MNTGVKIVWVVFATFILSFIVYMLSKIVLSPSTPHVYVCHDTTCETGWLKESCSCDGDQTLEVNGSMVICRCKDGGK